MIRVGITGSQGFIGSHLRNYLPLFGDGILMQPFERSWFNDRGQMEAFVRACDVIVHLAGVNRHADPVFIEDENKCLTQVLVDALDAAAVTPRVVFVSSVQEGNGTPYGRAKEWARNELASWASRSGSDFCGLILPNVFGPFGRPFYHSVVATFSHQLVAQEKPVILHERDLPLIYINTVCESIREAILGRISGALCRIPPDHILSVTELLARLQAFHSVYAGRMEIPALKSSFDTALFNTYRSYLGTTIFPAPLGLHQDERGALAEMIRTGSAGQVFYSVTRPGITRGNHFHLRKIERFCVVKGQATIRLRKVGSPQLIELQVDGKRPAVVDMPVWFTHNITNTGKEDNLTLFWSNEFYDPADPDTWYEEV